MAKLYTVILLAVLALLAACARSQDQGGPSLPSPAPTLSPGQGGQTAFMLCEADEDWVRPSREEQRQFLLNHENPRFRNDGVDGYLEYLEHHFFINAQNSASLDFIQVNVSGVGAAPPNALTTGACEEMREELRRKAEGQPNLALAVELMVLEHRVLAIQQESRDTFVVVVEPADKGYFVFLAPRPQPPDPLTFRFVDGEGREMAIIGPEDTSG